MVGKFLLTAREAIEGGFVLCQILCGVRPQGGSFIVLGVERHGIQFMIPHEGEGLAILHHGPHQLEGLPNLWPAIDVVSEKENLALGVNP